MREKRNKIRVLSLIGPRKFINDEAAKGKIIGTPPPEPEVEETAPKSVVETATLPPPPFPFNDDDDTISVIDDDDLRSETGLDETLDVSVGGTVTKISKNQKRKQKREEEKKQAEEIKKQA